MRRAVFTRYLLAGLSLACRSQTPVSAANESIASLRGPFVRIDIIHLPDEILTYARLSLDTLRRQRNLQIARVSASARLVRIVRLVRDARPRPREGGADFDARWELVFTTVEHGRVSLVFDRFGANGTLDERPIEFTGHPFVANLAALLPHFVK